MLSAINLATFMSLSRFSCCLFNLYNARSQKKKVNLIFIFLLQVREDPIFRREGNHVHVDAVLSIAQVISLSSNLIFLFLLKVQKCT
jgi:hypothetical protein